MGRPRLLIILCFWLSGIRAAFASCGDVNCGNDLVVVSQADSYTSPCSPASYGNNENCNRILRPLNVNYTRIALVTEFVTEAWYDYLKLDGPQNFLIFADSATDRAIITGFPGGNISADFLSDGSNTSTGFNASVTGISEEELLDQYSQYSKTSAVQLLKSPLYITSADDDARGIVFMNAPNTTNSFAEAWLSYAGLATNLSGIQTLSNTETGFEFTWTKIAGARRYELVVNWTVDPFTKNLGSSINRHEMRDLPSGTRFNITVKAINKLKQSFVLRGNGETAVKAPSDSQVYYKNRTSASLNWTTIPGAIEYEVTLNQNKTVRVKNPPKHFYELKPETKYVVSVVANFEVGPSTPKKLEFSTANGYCRDVVCGSNATCVYTPSPACACPDGYKGNPEIGCLAFCDKKELTTASGSVYNFSSISIDMTASSIQNCANGNPRAASVRCVMPQGKQRAEFSSTTLIEISCDIEINNVAKQIKTNSSADELTNKTAELLILTTGRNLTKTETDQVVDSIEKASQNTQGAVTHSVLQNTLGTVDNLIATGAIAPPTPTTSSTGESVSTTATDGDKMVKKRILTSLTDLVQQTVMPPNKNEIRISTPSMAVKVTDQPKNLTDDVQFEPLVAINASAADNVNTARPVGITVRAAAIKKAKAKGNKTRLTFFVFQDATLFPSSEPIALFKRIVSATVGTDQTLKGLKRDEEVLYYYNKNETVEPKQLSNKRRKQKIDHKCSYWQVDEGEWSTAGCCREPGNRSSCRCDHTTNYALLITAYDVPADVALDTVSDIGIVLSLVCLALTIVIHCLKEDVRNRRSTIILINICVNLFVANVIFAIGISKLADKTVCIAITAILQYFFLASWTWMTVYAYDMYVSLVVILGKAKSRYLTKCALFAYGTPLLITVLNVGIAVGYFDANAELPNVCVDEGEDYERDKRESLPSTYRADNMCWIHEYSLYLGFLLPVGLMLIFNLFVNVNVMRTVAGRGKEVRSTAKQTTTTDKVLISATLNASTGLAWLFGYMMLISPDETYQLVMSWIFLILNGLQGVAIFLTTCVRHESMRKIWCDPLRNCLSRCCPCIDSSSLHDKNQSATAYTNDDSPKNTTTLTSRM